MFYYNIHKDNSRFEKLYRRVPDKHLAIVCYKPDGDNVEFYSLLSILKKVMQYDHFDASSFSIFVSTALLEKF